MTPICMHHKSFAVPKFHEKRCCLCECMFQKEKLMTSSSLNMLSTFRATTAPTWVMTAKENKSGPLYPNLSCGQEKLGIGKTIPSWRPIQKRKYEDERENAHCLSKSTEW